METRRVIGRLHHNGLHRLMVIAGLATFVGGVYALLVRGAGALIGRNSGALVCARAGRTGANGGQNAAWSGGNPLRGAE